MLSGCPDCGGNKFQFKPESATSPDGSTSSREQPSEPDQSAGTAQPTGTDQSGADPSSPASTPSARSESTDDSEQVRERSEEDTAQASARSDVVSPDELDRASRDVSGTSDPDAPSANDHSADVPAESHPDIDNLREELNEQFESIRIVSPGQYELNLMELYDRQEYIISLQEDGRYVIEMPDAWGIGDE